MRTMSDSASNSSVAGTWHESARDGTLILDAVSYVSLAFGAAAIVIAAGFVIFAYSSAPYVDQWVFLNEFLSRGGVVDGQLLWQPHGPHRIPLGKAFYLADMFLFGGKNYSLLATIFIIQLAHLSVLGRA